MNPFNEFKTEVLRQILAAYTASYGRMLTEAEAIEYKETIELISLELARRQEQGQDIFVKKGEKGRGNFMAGLY